MTFQMHYGISEGLAHVEQILQDDVLYRKLSPSGIHYDI